MFFELDPLVVDCGALSAPENGLLVINDTTLGSLVTYSCIEGYNLIGDGMRTCLDNGSWSGQDPVCQSKCVCLCVCVCVQVER